MQTTDFKTVREFRSQAEFINSHKADVVFVACSDFRFRKPQSDFQNEVGQEVDLVVVPGGPGSLFMGEYGASEGKDYILSSILLLADLHSTDKIVLVQHWQCGAYGSAPTHKSKDLESIMDQQKQDLGRAKGLLQQAVQAKGLGNVEIITAMAFPEGDGRPVRFEEYQMQQR